MAIERELHRAACRNSLACALLALAIFACRSAALATRDRERVRVEPVFLVPRGAAAPTDEARSLIARHLLWAQSRYRELLGGVDTFELAPGAPLVLDGAKSIAEYEATQDGGAEDCVLELFRHDRVDRNSCATIYVVLFVGTGHWPGGGGRPINGGLNTGGGILVLACDDLAAPNFQSTLQHELGHAFGLPHVDVYGLDMASDPSLMSYNPRHHTNGFEPSPTPGALGPEDRRALNRAKRIFPRLALFPMPDFPPGAAPPPLVLLGPMTLRGEADYAGPAIVE